MCAELRNSGWVECRKAPIRLKEALNAELLNSLHMYWQQWGMCASKPALVQGCHCSYQVRFSIQQAGQHGTPQCRRQFFLWAAKRGNPLPQFPKPSNSFAKGDASLSFPLPNGKRCMYAGGMRVHAPHPPVTVMHAISDLPSFEYINPQKVYAIYDILSDDEDGKGKQSVDEVRKIHISSAHKYISDMEQSYTCAPLSEYQRMMRFGSKKLFNHVTRIFKDEITIERICRIPLLPNANHRRKFCINDIRITLHRFAWKIEALVSQQWTFGCS